MTDQPVLLGLHHLTAISARIRDNYRFYTGTLGMRLVKRSVNQDDVSAYHLFYADALGSPGTDLTFFDWPVPPERRGTRSIARTALRVASGQSLAWWNGRLREAGVRTGEIVERDGRWTLDLDDPEGQRLSLIADDGAGEAHPWERSPVPAAHQIRGLGPVLLSVPDPGPTETVLHGVMGLRFEREYPHPDHGGKTVRVHAMGEGGIDAEVHVVAEPGAPVGRQGAGGVHHVAFRCADDQYAPGPSG